MIARYTRPEMSNIWEQENRFGKMLQVEIAVAEVQASLGIIPRAAAKDIAKKSKFSVKRILEIEQTTKHDVIAFVTNVAQNVGENGKFVHYGMTSSDILDTALSLQILEAGALILEKVNELAMTLKKMTQKHQGTLCPGRTHGMFAEPTSFGVKMAGFLAELLRNRSRLIRAFEGMGICKLSGAVGTYSSQPIEVESKVAKKLGLIPETVATQVIPRDRHCEVFFALSCLMTGIERISVELRHLQRSDVGEVEEGFTQGQKGSSAMPHKKNPISAENLTGLSRLVRGYFHTAQENIVLWHERDISHSSVERVIFPDAFIVTDYALHRMNILLSGLQVNEKRMKENLESSQGQIFSSHLLLHLVEKGLSREDAYFHIQRICHSLGKGDHLREKILQDEVLKKYFTKAQLDLVFSGKKHQKAFKEITQRVRP
ncbi:MAG: adenylosuccinate lyase [Pseudobdellovibrionaceae bacterium]